MLFARRILGIVSGFYVSRFCVYCCVVARRDCTSFCFVGWFEIVSVVSRFWFHGSTFKVSGSMIVNA